MHLAGALLGKAKTLKDITDQLPDDLLPGVADVIAELMNSNPPILARDHTGDRFSLTRDGMLVMQRALLKAAPENEKPPVSVGTRPLSGRGLNNVRMRDYAEKADVSLWVQDDQRCSFCGHTNSHGVRKGSMRLCQECFKKGTRF